MVNKECPKEIDGVPVICTWEKEWQKKMGEYIEKKQDFILLGEKEYLEQVKNAYEQKKLKELIKIILLGGAGAAALPGITTTSLSAALGLGTFCVVDPEPISKTILLIVVGAILGTAAAILIWRIVKWVKDKAKIIEIEIETPFFKSGIKVEFQEN